ncbi:MAG: terminase small subunit protein [Rhizobiaceae bacterium]|nr:terminase small subunit protein [Rhizobiaceae bacterium]
MDEHEVLIPPARMGRPSDYSEALADTICERLTQGESLRAICRDDDMPHAGTVCRWLAKHDDFREQYSHAREAQAELMADELVEIADDGSNDWMERKDAEGELIGWRENGEALRRSALRVDTRKWIASRLLPKKYGDKLALGGSKDMDPIKTETDVSENETLRRIAFLLTKGMQAGGA